MSKVGEKRLSYVLYKGVLTDTNPIRHMGILGMKWGVRRYQNEDGTLTPAGKERYRDSDPLDSFVSSMGKTKVSDLDSYDYNSLLKANQDLLNKSIDDLLKGL